LRLPLPCCYIDGIRKAHTDPEPITINQLSSRGIGIAMAARHGSRRTRADQWLFGGKWRGTVKETRHPPPVPEAKPPNPVPVQKDEGVCLEKPRVQREVADVAPGRRSMPEMEINMKEVVAVLGVKVMAADMPPFMQLHAFRCAKRSHDNLDKFSSRQLAHDVKKVCSF
jgi:dynein light chain LC8-type